MQKDIEYLHLAIEKYGSQASLAIAINWITSNLDPAGEHFPVTQRRISAWINREGRLPLQMILPLKLALENVDINVPLQKLNAGLYLNGKRLRWFNKKNYQKFIKSSAKAKAADGVRA